MKRRGWITAIALALLGGSKAIAQYKLCPVCYTAQNSSKPFYIRVTNDEGGDSGQVLKVATVICNQCGAVYVQR